VAVTFVLQEAVVRCEQQVLDHTQFEESHQVASDWLQRMTDRLKLSSDWTGDKHSVSTRLQQVKDLSLLTPEGSAKLNDCLESAQRTIVNTGLAGRQIIQKEVEVLRQAWDQYAAELDDVNRKLNDAVEKWIAYEENYEKVNQEMKEMEKEVRDCGLVSTVDEKKAMVRKKQVRYLMFVDGNIFSND